MMELMTERLSLLKATCPILLELLTFFTGNSARARNARDKLAEKPITRTPSHAALLTDLKDLEHTLRSIPEVLCDYTDEDDKSVLDVLQTIESNFLNDTEDERDEAGYNAPEDFPRLHFLLVTIKTFELQSLDTRIDELCRKVRFETLPAQKSRKKLISALGICNLALKKHVIPGTITDISWASPDGKQAEWKGAADLFAEVEKMHTTLARTWTCSCKLQHCRESKFSFDLKSNSTEGPILCTLCYPDFRSSDGTAWKTTRVYYDVLKDEACHATSKTTSMNSKINICKVLTGLKERQCLKMDDYNTTSYTVMDTKHNDTDQCILPWQEITQARLLPFAKLKYRLQLALMLSYAYLHLSGGPWWPYYREHNISLNAKDDLSIEALSAPFFSTSMYDDNEEAPAHMTIYNEYMPNLPALGLLLLELVSGRQLDWNPQTIQKAMKDYEEEMHAAEILSAIKACTGLGDDKTFRKSESQIRVDERLRMHFVNEVVLKIQHVLDVAYGIKVQDIFSMPRPTKAQAALVPAISGMIITKLTTVETVAATFVPEGFCLHDGLEAEELVKQEADLADRWMNEMQTFVRKAIRQKLAYKPADIPKPVRVAVLDTGTDIPRSTLDTLYDSRLVECRSWLKSLLDEGELLFSADDEDQLHTGPLDDDGHGTHAASVLLQSTDGTDIEIFAAQVFGSRKEKISNTTNVQTAQAIAKAIRYAVDHWQVDVISMSFGFPTSDPVVKEAIDYAYGKHVLMFAAASNCGGNEKLSWPARDEHVLSIFATNGLGNKYAKNPTPQYRKHNFAVLGCSVKARWPGSDRQVYKSGTSSATPIASAIAAVMINLLRRSKKGYLNTFEDETTMKQVELEYEAKLRALGRPTAMAEVFKLMTGDDCRERDGYTYITPWTIHKQKQYRSTSMIDKILEKIEP